MQGATDRAGHVVGSGACNYETPSWMALCLRVCTCVLLCRVCVRVHACESVSIMRWASFCGRTRSAFRKHSVPRVILCAVAAFGYW